jgi:hypothetical protein
MADPKTPVDYREAFKAEVQDAVAFIDSDIAPLREAATRFYRAELFGDEEEGRSQYVAPVVREVVKPTLASLIRIFFGGQRVVEFVGGGETSAQIADDMTQAVEHVFMRQNDGFSVAWAAFKDALIRKVGWIMWYWDESVVVRGRVFDGCSEEQVVELHQSLQKQDTLEVLSKEQVGETGPQPIIDPESMQPVGVQPSQPIYGNYTVRLVTRRPLNQIRVCAVPPEEVIVCRDATSPYTARFIGRRRDITVGEALAMGISQQLIDEADGDSSTLSFNSEKSARSQNPMQGVDPVKMTPDQKKLYYVEGYWLVDQDGDGISERRRICTLGSNFVETHNEYADEVNLAALCPDPEPHEVWGSSQAEDVADLQVIESHVNRDLYDSLKLSIFPRISYVEGQANVDDVLNTEIGGAIRMRSQGAVQYLETPFLGQMAFPVIEDLQNKRESRTGLSKNAMGLDPRALQSTTQVAAAAAVSASQSQVEMIARVFAETGMKRLFRGLAKMLIERQGKDFMVPVNGQPKPLDPSKWNENANLAVDPSLGVGNTESKVAILKQTADAQAEAIEKLGDDNPLCGLQNLYNTQRRMLALVGFRDVHTFWTNPDVHKQTHEPPTPPPTPEQVLAQAQMDIEAGKLELGRLEAVLADDRERDKMELDAWVKIAEINATHGTKLDIASIEAVVDRQRNQLMEKRAAASAASKASPK